VYDSFPSHVDFKKTLIVECDALGHGVVGKYTLRTSKLGSDLHADYDHKEITFNLPPKT
jgi:hypothetical protein